MSNIYLCFFIIIIVCSLPGTKYANSWVYQMDNFLLGYLNEAFSRGFRFIIFPINVAIAYQYIKIKWTIEAGTKMKKILPGKPLQESVTLSLQTCQSQHELDVLFPTCYVQD